MDPNRLHPNGYNPTPPTNSNPNAIYATIGSTQQQPAYNPGWSIPSPGHTTNPSAFMPVHPPSPNPQNGMAYPQKPVAPTPMPPQNHYGSSPMHVPPLNQSPYGTMPIQMPSQNIYGSMPTYMPHQNNGGHAVPTIAYPQQPRHSITGLPGVPAYNPHPQIPLQAGAQLQKPGAISKEEQKRLKKLMKEQEKMEKKRAKANKHFH